MKKRFGFFAAVGLACMILAPASFADVTISTLGDARVVTGTTNSRDDNNGGNTSSGALIGVNTGGVDNFMIYDFSDLTAAAGQSVTGATVEIFVQGGFSHGQHGDAADIITLSEIALTNLGWDKGTSEIGGSDNQSDDGSVSFLNRVQYNDDPGAPSGTTTSWLDSGGNNVANLLGTLTSIDSQNGWANASGPVSMLFNVDAATAQSWVDNGLGGLALSSTDGGNGSSRFNMRSHNAGQTGAQITFHTVPEPASCTLLAVVTGFAMFRRRR